MATWRKFHAEHPEIVRATVQNLVAWDFCTLDYTEVYGFKMTLTLPLYSIYCTTIF
jgi:hypothetical protein